MAPRISSYYLGVQSLDWPPEYKQKPDAEKAGSEPPNEGASSSKSPTTDAQLRASFVQYIKGRLMLKKEEQSTDPIERAVLAQQKAAYWASLVIALDPTSSLNMLRAGCWKAVHSVFPDRSLKDYFSELHNHIRVYTDKIQTAWANSAAPKPDEETDNVDQISGQDVAEWYGNRCVLSTLSLPEMARIAPAPDDGLPGLWNILRHLWTLPQLEEGDLSGNKATNMLPMSAATHRQFSQYRFALRPIEEILDPQGCIMVQIVWLDESGGFADFNRLDPSGRFAAVKHGGVFQICTADPESRPLPSLHMLQMQYCAHRLLAGMRTVDALRDIFSDDPPEDVDDGWPVLEDDVPAPWRSLVEAAVEKGVLQPGAGERWKVAMAREYRS